MNLPERPARAARTWKPSPPSFANTTSVLAVYLFGSYAAGNPRYESDLDLAIVPRDESVREHMLDILADLIRQVHDRIDLVILDTRDVVLRFRSRPAQSAALPNERLRPWRIYVSHRA